MLETKISTNKTMNESIKKKIGMRLFFKNKSKFTNSDFPKKKEN